MLPTRLSRLWNTAVDLQRRNFRGSYVRKTARPSASPGCGRTGRWRIAMPHNHQRGPASVDPELAKDAKLEADPLLTEGKPSSAQKWMVGLVLIALVGLVVWALSQP